MRYRDVMSRSTVATIAGLAFVFLYIVVVVAIPDMIGRMHWLIEVVYWAVAGVIWVFPIRWLMLWAVGKR